MKEVVGFIKDGDTAVQIIPMLKEYLEINVKNDEQLVKLATIVQRIATQTKTSNADDEFGITDKEKEQLLASIKEVSNEVQDYNDKIISSREE
jgi:hypothetical protein